MVDLKHKLQGHKIWLQSFGKSGERFDIAGRDLKGHCFDGLDLTSALLSGADLTGASFVGSTLNGAALDECILNNVDFTGSELVKATVDNSTCRNANFSQANVFRTDFIASDLRSSLFVRAAPISPNFGLADIRWCKFTGVSIDKLYLDKTRCSIDNFDGAGGTVYGGPVYFEDEEVATSLEDAARRWQGRSDIQVLPEGFFDLT